MTSLGTVEINVKLNTNDLDNQLKKLKRVHIKPNIDLSGYKKGVTVPVSFSEKNYKKEVLLLKRKLAKDLKFDAKINIKAAKIEDKEKRKIEKDLKKEIKINTKLNVDISDAEKKLKKIEKENSEPIKKDVVLKIKKVDYKSLPNEIEVTPVLSKNSIKKIKKQLSNENITIKTKFLNQNIGSDNKQSATILSNRSSSNSVLNKDANKSILNSILNVNIRIEKSLELIVRNTNELYLLQKKSSGNIFSNALKGIGKFVSNLTISFAGSVFTGIGERFGNRVADRIVDKFDLDEKLNKKLDAIAVQFEKIAQKTSKFVTKVRNNVYGSEPVEGEEDEEGGTAVQNSGAKIRNGRRRLAVKRKYVKEKVIPAVKEVFSPETFKGDAEELGRAAKTLRLPLRKNKQSNARAISRIKKSLVGLYDVPAKNINKRTERILQQLTEDIEKRTEEIKKELPDELGKDNVIFAIGGFSGNQGRGGEKLGKEIEKKFQESYVVPVSNHLYDISQPIAENVPKAIYEVLFKKILKTTLVDGSIPTTKEYVAQAKAYAEKYNVPISAIGYSGGGFIAQQGQEILDKLGIETKTVAIGTPQTGYLQKHKKDLGFKSYMSKKDPIGKVVGPLKKGAKNIVDTEGAEKDVKKAHSIENYFEDAPVMEDIRKTFDIENRVKKIVKPKPLLKNKIKPESETRAIPKPVKKPLPELENKPESQTNLTERRNPNLPKVNLKLKVPVSIPLSGRSKAVVTFNFNANNILEKIGIINDSRNSSVGRIQRKPLNKTTSEIESDSEILKQKYTAKGIYKISKGMNIPFVSNKKSFDELAKNLAKYENISDIENYAKTLGEGIERIKKQSKIFEKVSVDREDFSQSSKHPRPIVKRVKLDNLTSVDKSSHVNISTPSVTPVDKPISNIIKPVNLPKNQLDEISKKLREEYTAKGLLQIAKSLGVKVSGQQRNLKPLSELIAKSVSFPDIQIVAKKLGDSVKRSSKKTGDSDIRPTLNSEDDIIKYLKDANDRLDIRIKNYNLNRNESLEKISEDIDNYIKSIDEIFKIYKYEGVTGKSLGGLISQLKEKQKYISNISSSQKDVRESNFSTNKSKDKENIQPVVNGLNARAIKDYKAIFKELGKKLGVDIEKIAIPNINVKTDFAVAGVKASYDEILNSVNVAPELLDILNAGIGESIDKLGEETVNESLSILVHELTHAFQAGVSKISMDDIFKGKSVVNVQAFDIPNPGEDLAKIIDNMVEMSTQGFIESLKKVNPDKSYAEIHKQYEVLIKEVRRRETEAYKAETVYSQEIIKSVKSRANKKGNKSKDDSPVHPARSNLGGEDGDLQSPELPLYSIGGVKSGNQQTKVSIQQKTLKEKTRKYLSDLYYLPSNYINKKRNLIYKQLEAEITKRSEEIKKGLPDSIGKSSVILAIGGFAGEGGKSSTRIAGNIQDKFQESLVVPVANKYFDVINVAEKNLIGWLSEIVFKKVLKTNFVDAVIPDTKEFAAQAKAYAEKYNVPVAGVGFSGGGFIVQQSIDLLENMGMGMKGIGIATPATGYLSKGKDNPNYQAYIAKNDPIGKMMMGLNKANIVTQGAPTLKKGESGHGIKNYLEDVDAMSSMSGHLGVSNKPVTPSLPLYSVGSVASKAKKAITDVTTEVEKRITDITQNLESIKKIAKKRPNIRRKISQVGMSIGIPSDYLDAAENMQAASAKVFVKKPGKKEDRKERFRQKKEAAIFERQLAENEAKKQAEITGLPYKPPKIKPITVTASDISGKVLELSEQVKDASEDWEQNVKPAVTEIFAPENFADAAKDLVANIGEYRATKKEKRLEVRAEKKKSAFAKIKKSLRDLINVPAKKINERTDKILDDLAVDVEKRAQEIINTLPEALPEGKDNALFAIGGFAGEKGKSSYRLADQVQEKFQGSHVVPVENTGFDVSAPITHDPISWVKEVVTKKVLRTNVVEGANPDTKEMAAQMLAYSKKYGVPVNAIGYSGGGFVAQQSQRLLERMGVQSKAVGIGNPQLGYLEGQRNGEEQSKGFRSYMAKFDPLSKLWKGRNVEKTKGVVAPDSGDGHAIKNYLGEAKTVASITKFLGLKAKDSGKELGFFGKHIKALKDRFIELKPSLDFAVRRFNYRNSQIGKLVDLIPNLVKNIGQAIPALKPFTDNLEALFSAGISYKIFEFFGKALLSVGKICIETATRFQKLETVTNFIAGSNKNAAKTFDFLSSEVSRLSIDTESAITGWNKLAATTRGTTLEGESTEKMFSGIAQAGLAFSLTGEEIQGSIIAISQIASKGTVSMEELRGQLSERIPGAMQIAARSMGMTEASFNDLVASGKLAATDFLPKFAKQLSMETAGGAEDSTKNITASMTRFNNSLTALKVNAGKPLLPMVAVGLDVVAKAMDSVAKYAGLLSKILVITVGVAFKDYIKTVWTLTVTLVKNEFTLKAIMARILLIGNAIWKFLIPKLVAMAPQILLFYALSKAVEVLYFAFDTFMSKTKGDVINKNLSKNFNEAGKKADELREKLAKLRGEIETKSEKEKPKSENVTNFKLARKKQEEESKKDSLFDKITGFKKISRGMEDWTSKSKDIKEKRSAKITKESATSGLIKQLRNDVDNIISSSDLIIAKTKEKNDAIGRLTAQAKSAEGKNLEDIKKKIEILQTESQVELYKVGDKSLGLANIESTAESVSSTIATLKEDLANTVSDEPRKIISDQITKLEEYKKKIDDLSKDIGSSDSITQFLINIAKIGSNFEQVSYDTDKFLTKIKTSINENLKENLTKDFSAENNASLEQVKSEIFATQSKLKASKELTDSLIGTLKSSGGEVGENYKKYSDIEKYPLQKLQSELEKTDEKDIARKSTLEALIKLREGEGATLELQATLQEQLLQQERERMRVGQEKLDRELNINKSKIDINDANNQSNAVHLQTIGGTSQDEIGLIDASNQLKSAQQKEVLRQQELAGVKKLQANKLISAKDYENKVRELTVQGAQNNLAILQAKLGEEQALRAKEVGKIQRQLEQAKVDSEAKQTDIGFNVERKGFDIQQNNLKEQISTGKSDELNKQLEYQKQLAEKSGDISKQEKISAEIYKNQLASLAVKQDLQTKSLELTQAQQRLEMQRLEMQAQVALLEAESQVNQLQANKATAEEIAIAQQTVDIRQKQVNFISEQKANLSEVQKLEQQNLSVQNESQKKDLERSKNLQVIEEAEKRISKEIEIAKSNNELRNKEIERSSQLLNSQLELYKVQSDYKKSELDFQAELANKVNNVSALETIKAISYADQVASLKVQNLAQTESLKLTQEQQRIQAEIDVLDAQATLRKLELNKGSAQDIELAKQQLDAAQQQLGNLEAIQSNERERVGIEQQSALKNLERQQYLEMQDLAVKKITSSLEQQSKLFNAQQNVAQSNAELDKQRLDYQLELANRSGDINRIEQLKAEIYLQQREEILRQGDAQLKSLDITQKQNNIELERQKLMAQSLLLEAKANLEKGKLKGASAQELNDLQQYVTIQEQQLSGIQQLVSANQEVQSLEKQQLEIQQQTKLEQIDQQRQLELIDLQVQKITKSYESQQQQLDLNNSELERQSALVNAKSGLNDSVSNLEKQQLDFRMQLAELAENEVQKQQIKQQLYEQELKSLAQRQAIERETLKIAQLKQNIDIKRQEIQAEIATLEAQANIEQAKARGAGESELAALYKVLALRMQQEKSVQADKVNLAQIQQLERQKLNVDQTAANENLQQQRILDQARTAKEQQQKNSKGGNIVDTGINLPLNINIPPLKPLPIEEVKISKTDSDKKNEIIESMKVTATNVYINGTVSASSGQNVNIETQNSDLEKVKKIENEINKLAKESRLKAANAAMDAYIANWNNESEKERIASGLSAEQATAGGYEQARLAREEAERIKADLASGKLKTTGAEGFKPQAIMTPLQRLQAELDAAQKAVDNSKNKPNKNTSNSQETECGTNVNVENLVIVSSDPTGDARQVLNDLAASKGKC